MIRASALSFLLFAIGSVVLLGCGGPSVTMDQDPSAFEEEENRLEEQLSDNPDDGEALRDLGSIYLRTDRPSEAYDALKKAYSKRPDDPKVLFYLGMASEQVGRSEAALKLFGKYGEVPEDSKYHTLMEGRYQWLSRKQAEKQAQQLVAKEKNQPEQVGADVSPDVVAVLPMQYQGGDEKYEALGRGLAEMFTTDLANVDRLKVVERVRLQALLDELKLAQSEYVDQSTAPRVGRLLGAGRLVGGSYLVSGEELRLQVTLADVATGERIPQLENQRAGLDELFDLQTRVTFSIVDQLDVELTPQERAAIEEVPTQSIQAFLAYSRGLMEEDRGNYGAAAEYYQQAAQIDPNFQKAKENQKKAKSVQAGGGSQSKALASASGDQSGQQSGQQSSSINNTNQVLQSLGPTPNAGLGQESGGGGDGERDGPQESTNAEEEASLDDPPAPPPQQ
jgi:TolB-like protein